MFTKMAGKRSATTELNHDNWDKEDRPEEAGTFKKAPNEVMEKRVVKRAKRRLQPSDDSSKSAFGAFTGFKTVTASAGNPSPFSFLANSNTSTNTNTNDTSSKTVTNINKSTTNDGIKRNENGTSKQNISDSQTNQKSDSDQKDKNIFKKSTDYFAKLKGLNESVAQWIKTHVDSNPFCILTPIFQDYERYLKEIESKHGNETEKSSPSEHAQSTNDNKEAVSAEKKFESSPFGSTSAKSFNTTEWKPEKSIFSNMNTNSKSIFGQSDGTADSNKSIFSIDQGFDSHKSLFGNVEQKSGSKSIFGNVSSEKNPFLSKPSTATDNKTNEQETKSDSKNITPMTTTSSFPTTNTTTFCFGQSSATSNTSTGFSFGSAKPFTFGAQMVKPQEPENSEAEEEDDEPPKSDFKPITEEGAIYQQRCKVFFKKDGNFVDKGIGTLFLKPTPNDKIQLLVRAETCSGNLLLNTLLTESIPTKRMNKNTVMLACVPNPESSPPPVPVLLRVKTEEDADALLEALIKNKK
ncbi:nuclear pore complex protein Nup50 [Ceratina calcarata]|uniref:Nuclear pore complex protein Nup50 n=1 Tax=Ceratina calcarata TaxID=156304 RepID=A0AAJ7NEN0_9HYME|nr:nuclear pore complex protein Nup50 [Ceratina calcarata]